MSDIAAPTDIRSLAQLLWAAERTVFAAEEKIGGLLDEMLGSEGWDDFRTDPYDESIEIFGVHPECMLEVADRQQLRDAGFLRAWTHTHPTKTRQPGERCYSMATVAASK